MLDLLIIFGAIFFLSYEIIRHFRQKKRLNKYYEKHEYNLQRQSELWNPAVLKAAFRTHTGKDIEFKNATEQELAIKAILAIEGYNYYDINTVLNDPEHRNIVKDG